MGGVVATKKKREPAVLRIGRSPLTGKIYVGKTRGLQWIGKKHDITQSFMQTMIEFLEAERDAALPLPFSVRDGTYAWYITIKRTLDLSKQRKKR
jgi:hypothetical protein